MGREIRRVAANWQHPKNKQGNYIPLFENFKKRLTEWDEANEQWNKGFKESWNEGEKWIPKEGDDMNFTYESWNGERPVEEEYMPEWSEEEKTHIQLYETTSEGTPTTPVFKADEFEQLCKYAAKKCFTFADCEATKEEWMEMLSDGLVYTTRGNITFI